MLEETGENKESKEDQARMVHSDQQVAVDQQDPQDLEE